MTDLRFDRADYGSEAAPADETAAPAVACSACRNPVTDAYYKINFEIFCKSCYDRILAAREKGGAVGRVALALALGLLAGAVGFGLYYAILALTGYEVGLIAIVVGFLVGVAVRKGSNHRGGWLYQGIAIVITYVSIVTTYVPFMIDSFFEEMDAASVAMTEESTAQEGLLGEDDSSAADGAPAGNDASAGAGEDVLAAPAQDPAPAQLRREDLGVIDWAALLVVAFFLSLAAPVLAGFQNVLGMIIIGFALWEAWKINKRVPLEMEGPFQVGAAPA